MLPAGPGRAFASPNVGSDYIYTVNIQKLLALSSVRNQSRAAVGYKAARVVLRAILEDPAKGSGSRVESKSLDYRGWLY